MRQHQESINVKDSKNHWHKVKVVYDPHLGLVRAYYQDKQIVQCKGKKMAETLSDSDMYWERYEELFKDWSEDMKTRNVIPSCEKYFNRLHNVVVRYTKPIPKPLKLNRIDYSLDVVDPSTSC